MNDPASNDPASHELPDDLNLLKTVLPPLLNDFQTWFGQTITRLEGNQASFLTVEQQQDLLRRVQSARQQVSVAQALSAATGSQAGIDMPVIMRWHKLVHECWGVAIRMRREQSAGNTTDS
ncbi:MAG: DUF2605 domain-containing protein [Cyanobacteria bacterium P01_D01_bin.105]